MKSESEKEIGEKQNRRQRKAKRLADALDTFAIPHFELPKFEGISFCRECFCGVVLPGMVAPTPWQPGGTGKHLTRGGKDELFIRPKPSQRNDALKP